MSRKAGEARSVYAAPSSIGKDRLRGSLSAAASTSPPRPIPRCRRSQPRARRSHAVDAPFSPADLLRQAADSLFGRKSKNVVSRSGVCVRAAHTESCRSAVACGARGAGRGARGAGRGARGAGRGARGAAPRGASKISLHGRVAARTATESMPRANESTVSAENAERSPPSRGAAGPAFSGQRQAPDDPAAFVIDAVTLSPRERGHASRRLLRSRAISFRDLQIGRSLREISANFRPSARAPDRQFAPCELQSSHVHRVGRRGGVFPPRLSTKYLRADARGGVQLH